VILNADTRRWYGLAIELKRCWYSAAVMKEQTMARCLLKSRKGALLT
jgi:hypothetical protein